MSRLGSFRTSLTALPDPARLAGAIEDAQKAVGGGRTAILNVAMAR